MSVISMSNGANLESLIYLDRYWSSMVKAFSFRPPNAVFKPFRLKKIKEDFKSNVVTKSVTPKAVTSFMNDPSKS